jgi:16S rRNA A1518/A1519 N6-dimethyltransferase RsmA/KsgA/DIM1 with predicted DNA glycosylase/AP lyase activity
MDRLHAAVGIDPGRRAETLSVEDFCRLADFLQGEASEKTRE